MTRAEVARMTILQLIDLRIETKDALDAKPMDAPGPELQVLGWIAEELKIRAAAIKPFPQRDRR